MLVEDLLVEDLLLLDLVLDPLERFVAPLVLPLLALLLRVFEAEPLLLFEVARLLDVFLAAVLGVLPELLALDLEPLALPVEDLFEVVLVLDVLWDVLAFELPLLALDAPEVLVLLLLPDAADLDLDVPDFDEPLLADDVRRVLVRFLALEPVWLVPDWVELDGAAPDWLDPDGGAPELVELDWDVLDWPEVDDDEPEPVVLPVEMASPALSAADLAWVSA
ncbi:hypothetical protein V5738_13030 [Salinisphaera sp. SPP-AMP-43]|uniref:hypothetical protein n=1 Tax=Salinisphaera sp. SPP-AMP-43 TaxID=3121288 RepID=UPI003C6DF1DD